MAEAIVQLRAIYLSGDFGRDLADSVDGGEEKAVPELTKAGYCRYWGVSSNGLHFTSHEGGSQYPLMVFDFDTRKVRQFALMKKEPLWWVPGLSIAPDRQSFLYGQRDAGGSDIMMLDQFSLTAGSVFEKRGEHGRPALTRLLQAVEVRELDCVVVYMGDRTSREVPLTPGALCAIDPRPDHYFL